MKKKKLNINNLEVQSFVTSFENNKEQTVKGGTGNTVCVITCVDVAGECITATIPAVGDPNCIFQPY